MRRALVGLGVIVAGAVLFVDARRAEACGGCFVPPTEHTVVTDHRMALAVSPQQTVLWDQIRYSGDPSEFAWVLPVRAGTTIELSNDEWFAALDASSQPTISAPNVIGGSYGCGLTGCASNTASDDSAYSPGAGQVQVLSESVVGPYETVTLRATDPNALTNWLKGHAYDIPTPIVPTIDAYVGEGFDFIALRLVPNCGERAMRPVRVITQGADPTLPLRMVAAGAGANVGITLYVISEGRFHPQNFPDAVLDETKLRWDRTTNKSNYDELSQEIMAQANGHTWLTEFADKAQTTATYQNPYAYGYYGSATPGLADAYFSQCKSQLYPDPSSTGSSGTQTPLVPCPQSDAGITVTPPKDAGVDASTNDAGNDDAGDGGDDDASSNDAGLPDFDAGAGQGDDDSSNPPPSTTVNPTACAYLDDLDVALRGLHQGDVWVTRLRAVLAQNALSEGDLRLEATQDQSPVSNVHFAAYYADDDSPASRDACVSAPKQHTAFGSWAFAASAALIAIAYLRRRR